MDTPGDPERLASMALAGSWSWVLPYLALFVRLAIGLTLLDLGLATILRAGQPSPFGGPPAWGGGGWGGSRSQSWIPGLELLVMILPYATLAIGIGLVLGIFTTLSALLACGLALVFPLVLAFYLVVMGNATGPGMMGPFGPGFGPDVAIMLVVLAVAAIPVLVALVLLSPPTINRFSVDVLIFQRRATLRPRPTFQPPASGGTVGRAGTDQAPPEEPRPDPFASV